MIDKRPIQGEVGVHLEASCYKNRNKPCRTHASYTPFPFFPGRGKGRSPIWPKQVCFCVLNGVTFWIRSLSKNVKVGESGLLESFRFEDDNNYEYDEIKLKVFVRVLKERQPGKLVRLFILKEVEPFPDNKMIKLFTLLTLTATFSLKSAVEGRGLSRFLAKMTQVYE